MLHYAREHSFRKKAWLFPNLCGSIPKGPDHVYCVCLSVRLSVRPSVRPSVCLSETKIWSFENKIWRWCRGGSAKRTRRPEKLSSAPRFTSSISGRPTSSCSFVDRGRISFKRSGRYQIHVPYLGLTKPENSLNFNIQSLEFCECAVHCSSNRFQNSS